MQLYSMTPARRTRQIVVDLLAVLWLLLAVWAGTTVHDAVTVVADQARGVDAAGTDLAAGLSDAGDTLDGTPVVGDEIAAPFEAMAGSAEGIAQSGSDTADAIDTVAFLTGLATAVVLLLVAAPWYLPGRIRFILTATLLKRFVAGPDDVDLLALRALARQPVRRLRTVPDAARRWRAADPEAISALADLELRAAGLVLDTRPGGRLG